MPLDEYKKKRRFDKTSEPSGGKPEDEKLHFVVQKHAASHLHYDFRLEVKGVLKSWAVPKGPSLDPEDRKLAMLVEDHPYDYKNFEGIIPKGQYGGGFVIIWDQGTFDTPVIDEKDKKAQEHSITSQFYKGEVLITLYGQKLKGKFALIRDPEGDNKRWFLIKVKDKHAAKTDVTKKDKSVVSRLTVEEMAKNADARTWQSNRAAVEKKEDTNDDSNDSNMLLKKGTKTEMPQQLQPMECTLIKEPFSNEEWLFELKLDGYRIASIIQGGKAKILTRKGLNYSKYYPEVIAALSQIRRDVILDGEVVVLDDKGRPNFDLLQKYKGNDPIAYYCFDVIWVDGYDVTTLPLTERKALLKQILPESEIIKYSEDFEDGIALFEQIKQMELEGIVAKRRASTYQQGKRGKDWLKLPTKIRQEFVIGGWTESGSGRYFRSILFGAYDKGELKFVGHAGSGFKDEVMKDIWERITKLEIKKKPFVDEVDHTTKPHWIKPQLVANFEFSTWTAQGKIRKPAIFLGFRDDKDPKDVVREVPLTETEERTVVEETSAAPTEPNTSPQPKAKTEITTAADSNWPELEKQEITSSEEFEIAGKRLTLTNVERELWPGITKAHLIQYYHAVTPYILPYLVNRPQSLHVKHIKPTAPGLYIKDMEGRQPEWAEIFTVKRKHKKKGKRDVIDYLVCADEATLLYMVNRGCIDINPWTSRTTDYLHPDFIIIDLDPSDDDFQKVIETAKAAKQYFDANKLKAFPKTSGKTGIHLYIPCEGFTFPQARTIAEHICKEIHLLVTDITTTEVSISQRGTKLYIDPNQNDEADTVAAPYTVRPYKLPTVSTPLAWKEINNKLDPTDYNVHSILQRIEKKGDLFEGVFDEKVIRANSVKLKDFVTG